MKTLIRAKKLEELYDAIMNRKNLHLEAPLGYGASFLLSRLEERLVNRRICFRYTFNSSQKFGTFKKAFFAELEKQAQEKPNLSFQLSRFYQETAYVTMQNFADFHQCLKLLADHLQQVGLDFLFIFEHIEDWNLDLQEKGMLEAFSHLAEARNIQVLLNSDASLKIPSKLKLEKHALAKASAEDIWENPSAFEHELYEFSQGNLQLLNALLAKKQEKAAEAIVNLLKEVHPLFKLFQHRFTDLQWKLLQAIAIEERVEQPHAFAFLVKYNLGAASSIERALQNLLSTKLIQRDEQAYFVHDQLFLRWLQWLAKQ
jgi:hypothetical protein